MTPAMARALRTSSGKWPIWWLLWRLRTPHLARYLSEFDFRYNLRADLGVSNAERADEAVRGVVGKRLTYDQPAQAA
jgi:hypothetical protein